MRFSDWRIARSRRQIRIKTSRPRRPRFGQNVCDKQHVRGTKTQILGDFCVTARFVFQAHFGVEIRRQIRPQIPSVGILKEQIFNAETTTDKLLLLDTFL